MTKNMVVLKSGTGDYYLLPQELLEHGRVSAEQSAEVAQLFDQAMTDDVAGHLNFTKIEYKNTLLGALIASDSPATSTFRKLAYNAEIIRDGGDAGGPLTHRIR